ncbi:hypothetical protein [Microbacterium sp. 179-I 3D4 NHS]|uniref:hypothetical protein n=1 Tax=Microbacterium sp. 179-I 3D4 NHS TaxID=3142381 RepID=UPI0039A1B9A7
MATKKPSRNGAALRKSQRMKAASAGKSRVIRTTGSDLNSTASLRNAEAKSVTAQTVVNRAPRSTSAEVAAGSVVTQSLMIPARTELVAKALGSRAVLARTLGVSNSQPTRWISGQESPNSENTRAIVDLEHVVARARLLWADDDTVNSWLIGNNAYLDGARPIDVITTQGSGPVIDALDQAMAGAFA